MKQNPPGDVKARDLTFGMLSGSKQFELCVNHLKTGKLYRAKQKILTWREPTNNSELEEGYSFVPKGAHWYEIPEGSWLLYLESSSYQWNHSFLDRHGIIVKLNSISAHEHITTKDQE